MFTQKHMNILKKLVRDKRSSLFRSSISDEENVLKYSVCHRQVIMLQCHSEAYDQLKKLVWDKHSSLFSNSVGDVEKLF